MTFRYVTFHSRYCRIDCIYWYRLTSKLSLEPVTPLVPFTSPKVFQEFSCSSANKLIKHENISIARFTAIYTVDSEAVLKGKGTIVQKRCPRFLFILDSESGISIDVISVVHNAFRNDVFLDLSQLLMDPSTLTEVPKNRYYSSMLHLKGIERESSLFRVLCTEDG